MKRSRFIAYSLAIVICAGAAALAPVGGGDFDLSWHTIDGGGGSSTGGGFELAGTIGQADAGAVLTGGEFTLTGGYWAAVAGVTDPCPADLDDSGAVDFGDILAILSAWGNKGGPEDLDGSGVVDFGDILVVLEAWGPCP